ncbi:MAG: long-chain fatty acid--CoA ligase [Betaproteobacteria bacterium]|nr:MAG: long-chain fatty acid--CoA ligase [Betaproteobacteria bacterium]
MSSVESPSPDHNLAALLVSSAERHPALPAVAVGSVVYHDYAALAVRVAQLAATLSAASFLAGERIALVARNSPEYIEALFACWHAGLCAVPVNSKLHPSELAYVLDHSGARWAFVDASWHATLEGRNGELPSLERVIGFGSREYASLFGDARRDEPAAVAPADPAWLFYTSGTTGRPKGAILSHANLSAMSESFLTGVEPVAAGDAILHAAPLSHGSGLYVLPHVQRAAVNVVPESGGFDPEETMALLARWANTRFFAAPTMVKRLVAHRALGDAPLEHLASIIYGGAPMYVEDCKTAYAALGSRLAQIYGQGESPMTITAMPRAMLAAAIEQDDDARLGSVGVAQVGVEIRIGDADGAVLPLGEVGEVLVRGPTVMQGYWMNPEATAATLAGGWLHTGDVGCLDSDGFLTLKDRSKDLIISGGSNIYPREIEEVLQRHRDVAEVAVIGRRHPDWGEEVVACVVARREANAAALERELDALCLEHVARFKRPKAYVFFAELPKNSTGKVLKTVLRERVGNDKRPFQHTRSP